MTSERELSHFASSLAGHRYIMQEKIHQDLQLDLLHRLRIRSIRHIQGKDYGMACSRGSMIRK